MLTSSKNNNNGWLEIRPAKIEYCIALFWVAFKTYKEGGE